MEKLVSFTQADHILAKSCQTPFLVEMKEGPENGLYLSVLGSVIEEKDASCGVCENPDVNRILSQCRPIVPDISKIFEIVFEDYIIYQVRNESYVSYDDTEKRLGNYLVQFENSHFLDYVFTAIDACRLKNGSFYPAPWKHYGICTQNHIVDVIAYGEPKVFYSENE